MFVKGDKIITTKEIFGIKEREIFEVTDVTDEFVSFEKKTENGKFTSTISTNLMRECFEKYEEPKKEVITSLTPEYIDEILINSKINIETVFDKCTIVSCQLPNGFVIVESADCVDPKNYDEDMGVDICLDKITDKIWELEGYRLHHQLYERMGSDECPYDCDDCPCTGCDDEEDEFIDTDLDCNDCDNNDCPYNTNY